MFGRSTPGKDAYNNFLANTNAGFDAAGRPTYSAPTMMYMGPSEFAGTQSTHRKLQLAAEQEESERERQIRQLLDRLAQYEQPGYKFDYRMIQAGRDR